MKISDHHVRSPVLNINNACQTCHKFSEEEMRDRVNSIQDKNREMRDMAMDGLMDLIDRINAAKEKGTAQGAIDEALVCQRRATFLIDFIEAENSSGFHAPQEAARILFKAMDHLRLGNRALSQADEAANQVAAAM